MLSVLLRRPVIIYVTPRGEPQCVLEETEGRLSRSLKKQTNKIIPQSHTTWAWNPKGLIIQHGTLICDCFPKPTQTFATTWLQIFAAAAAGDADRYGMQTWDAGRVQQFTQRLERHVCVAVNSVRARLLFARNKVFRSAEERGRTGAQQQQRQQQVTCRQETRLDGFIYLFFHLYTGCHQIFQLGKFIKCEHVQSWFIFISCKVKISCHSIPSWQLKRQILGLNKLVLIPCRKCGIASNLIILWEKTRQIRQRLALRWLLLLFPRKKNSPKRLPHQRVCPAVVRHRVPVTPLTTAVKLVWGWLSGTRSFRTQRRPFFFLKPNVFGTIVQSDDSEQMPNRTTPVDESKAPICMEFYCIFYFLSFCKAKNGAVFFPLQSCAVMWLHTPMPDCVNTLGKQDTPLSTEFWRIFCPTVGILREI